MEVDSSHISPIQTPTGVAVAGPRLEEVDALLELSRIAAQEAYPSPAVIPGTGTSVKVEENQALQPIGRVAPSTAASEEREEDYEIVEELEGGQLAVGSPFFVPTPFCLYIYFSSSFYYHVIVCIDMFDVGALSASVLPYISYFCFIVGEGAYNEADPMQVDYPPQVKQEEAPNNEPPVALMASTEVEGRRSGRVKKPSSKLQVFLSLVTTSVLFKFALILNHDLL